jgi:hypothetical protein
MEESKDGASLTKPAGFFIGLTDLFSILLPGSLASLSLYGLYVMHYRHASYIQEMRSEIPDGSHWPFWLALALSSYLFGHLIFLLGSTTLDNVYDATYRKLKRESDAVQNRARLVLRECVGLSAAELDSALQWSTVFARIRVPSVMVEVDRLEADSKFVRSLSILILLADAMTTAVSAKTILLRTVAAILPILSLAIALGMGRWRDREKRIRKIAYKRYLKRLTTQAPMADSESQDWTDAAADINRREWAAVLSLLAAVSVQTLIGILSNSVDYAVFHCIAGSFLILSIWRFMERRYKRTVLTYRLFIASFAPEIKM